MVTNGYYRSLTITLMVLGMLFTTASCAKNEVPAQVLQDEPLVYLKVVDAKASSFDSTPDWAPPPDPMAPVDGDMLTRWSCELELDGEWIYFDFGKEKTLSKITIRWEQAHATDYDIHVSQDAKNWKNIQKVKNAKGGVDILEFPPVKTRFVKIVGIKRNNPKWGFSIWEMEFYGPRSLNPEDRISEADYLKKDEFEKKIKELERMISERAARPGPLTKNEFHKGVVYTSWSAEELSDIASDLTLVYLHDFGVKHIAIMIPAYQEEINSTVIYTNDSKGGDTPTDESLEHAISVAHSLGMKVMLKPHVDPRTGEARIDIMGSSEWFASYKNFVVRYAKLAEKNKCEIFAIGTELESTTMPRWEPAWRDIIKAVKAVYSGTLIYAANWTEYKEVPFWDDMDYVGIDAYFPLTKKDDPTYDELVAAWEKHADDIEAWLKDENIEKGVIFTELGYSSVEGTNKNPWTQLKDIEDQKEQSDCMKAVFEVLSARGWFKGVYLWQYFPQERWSPLGFTIKGKEVESIVKDRFSKIK